MRNRMLVLAAGMAGLVASLAACGGDSTGPPPATLAGTWTATKAEFAMASNQAVKVEIIHSGATLVLQLNANHTYTYTVTMPGEQPEVVSNTWSATADVLTLNLPNGEMQFDMTLSGNSLTLTGGHTPFDVDGNGIEEESIASLILTR